MSLTGIILDVSHSMRSRIKTGTNEEHGPWSQTAFNVIDDFIELHHSPENRMFAIGVGANCAGNYSGNEIFDLIGTVEKVMDIMEIPATESHIDDILNILEKNGARNVRKWTRDIALIQQTVSDYAATKILGNLESDKRFRWLFVHEFLPAAVRDTETTGPHAAPGVSTGIRAVAFTRKDSVYSSLLSRIKPATKEDIEKIVERAKSYMISKGQWIRMEDVGMQSIFSVQDAAHIIRGCVDDKTLSTKRRLQLLENIEPFIYGLTPLYQSLEKALSLFEKDTSGNKFLFVLSDGQPTDGKNRKKNINEISSQLSKAGVKIVSCFITESAEIQPKHLYDEMQPGWKPGAKFLFSLSSKVPTQHLPRAILIKRGWTIDVAKNETKLFVQVNYPDNLRYAH